MKVVWEMSRRMIFYHLCGESFHISEIIPMPKIINDNQLVLFNTVIHVMY